MVSWLQGFVATKAMVRNYSGFGRLGNGYTNVLAPEAVLARLELLPKGKSLTDAKFAAAPAELDAFAEHLLPPIELDARIRSDNRDLALLLFGLDMPNDVMRLRAAVARAWQVAWRYTDALCNYDAAISGRERRMNRLLAALNRLEGDLGAAAPALDQAPRGQYPAMKCLRPQSRFEMHWIHFAIG